MKRRLLAAVAGSLLLLAGCSNDGAGLPSGDVGMAAPQIAAPGTAAEAMPGQTLPGQTLRDQQPLQADRREVVTGQMFVTTDDPIEASRDAVEFVQSTGGRIDSRSDNPETDATVASSTITARIPAAELDAVVDRISGLGKVTAVTVTRDDVTMQYQDLDARIGALTASVNRLRELVDTATATADLIEAESALASRQGELDSLTAQRDYLADQVELSTLTVHFDTVDASPSGGPDNFFEGVVAGWNALLAAAAAVVVAAGRALPWLLAVVLVGAVIYGIVRVRRSRRNRADATPRT